MKNVFVIGVLLLFNLGFGQTTAIPDANFEAQLIALGYDSNGANGNILNSDALLVTSLITNRNDITDFDGLQAFRNLVTLNLGQNQFLTLPLNNLTALEELIFIGNEVLNNLDVGANTNLQRLDVRSIAGINTTSITELDLSSNIRLEYIRIFNFQDLDTIILPQAKSLTYLDIYSNFNVVVDTSFYDNLETLNLIATGGVQIALTLPDVKTNLRQIRISGGQIRDFRGLAEFVNLEELRLFTSTELIEFPESNTLNLVVIRPHSISDNLSFESLPQLSLLDIRLNSTTIPLEIDISQNAELETLILSENSMVNVNVSGNPKLTEVDISQNNVEQIDFTKNPLVEKLFLNGNLLRNIDLRDNQRLVELNLSENRLESIDITENILLSDFDISKNLFTGDGPDLSQNQELVNLNMSNNKISTLDITAARKLENVDLSFNQLSGNTILEQIVQNYQVSGRFLGGETFLLNDNLLSNAMPDFTSIVDGSTTDFSLSIHNNSFHFGDLEERHQEYVDYSNTARNGGTIFKTYSYAGQSKVNVREVVTTVAGEPITLTTTVRGTQNHYKWFKDGVEIIGAADAPEYTIPNPGACESGIYYTEITSDLMPFENTDSPGSNGKNLILQRNDIVLGANGVPSCAILVNPLNKAVEIPINTGIEWDSESGACGYLLSVGTSTGATDILNAEDVGNVSAYNFSNFLPGDSEIFVTITPYFENGPLAGCREESFSTNSELALPECSELRQPLAGSVGVAVDTDITWSAASGAEGYRIRIGTTSGASDLANANVENGSTTFDPTDDFLLNTEVFVTITPYNSQGDAIGCAESSFFISEADQLPPCTSLNRPLNGDIDVRTNTLIRWNQVGNANGYVVNIGTTEFGSEILSRDIGSEIELQLENNLPDDETIYVTVIPYNIQGSSVSCVSESFTTAILAPLPACTTLVTPSNGERDVNPFVDLAWNISENAEGYILEVGTTPDGDDFFSQDVGLTTFYNFITDLPEGRPIYVKITPYNERGEAEGCLTESFITNVPTIPDCTTLALPINGETEVSVATNFSWNMANTAKGYKLILGTASGESDILSEDVGATTFFDLPENLPEDTTIFVTITPYNDEGEPLECQEESFTTAAAIVAPQCTQFLTPMDGETNVSVFTDIAWQTIDNAAGYSLGIGTSSGASDIFEGEVTAGNALDYDGMLPENTEIYVRVIPFNEAGTATACEEILFTTTSAPMIPQCSILTMPMNEATGISVETNLAWTSLSNAEGYVLSLGTTSGNSDIFTADVGKATFYDLPNDLPENSTIYVSIFAYNESGMALNCMEEQFETTSEPGIPTCTNMIIPKNQEEDVNVATDIAWALVSNAQGYILNVGTTSQGTEIFLGDVGSTTYYDLPQDLPENTTIYVSVIPYNDLGESLNCIEESFATANAPTIPSCTIMTNPVNGSRAVNPNITLAWNAIADVTGYRLFLSTSPGLYDILDNLDVGDVNQYDLEEILPLGAQIYIEVQPYNDLGTNMTCEPESFTTATTQLEPVPFCTDIYEPINGQSNIPLNTTIRWNEILDIDGYVLSLGTSEGGVDILDQLDVGNATAYEISNLPPATIIYASVNPYNAQGFPEGCSHSTFITVFEEDSMNDTKFALTPNGDGINDFWRIDGIEAYSNNVVRIFNRWGDEVHRTNGYNNLTNVFAGEANRKTTLGAGQLPAGTYFYDIRIEGEHNIDTLRGYLILKR